MCSSDLINCRLFVHEGIEYTEPPKAMIINAILKSVYSEQKIESATKKDYQLPDNLQRFFNGLGREED